MVLTVLDVAGEPLVTKTMPRSLLEAFDKGYGFDAEQVYAKDRVVLVRQVCHVRHLIGTCNRMIVEVPGKDDDFHLFDAAHGDFEKDDMVIVFLPKAFLPRDAHPNFKSGGGSDLTVVNGQVGIQVEYTCNHGLYNHGIVKRLEEFPEVEVLFDGLAEFYGCELQAISDVNSLFDLERVLGVTRWEAKLSPHSIGPAPAFYRKAGMPRLQDCPDLLKKDNLKERTYQETAKMDGCTMSVYFTPKRSPFFGTLHPLPQPHGPHMMLSNGRFGVCSATQDLTEREDCLYWKVALQAKLPEIMNRQNIDMVLQGELVGDNIKQNRHGYGKGQHDFYAFDIYDHLDDADWLPANEVVAWCKEVGVKHVPVKGYRYVIETPGCLEDFYRRAVEQKKPDGSHEEGLVFKCLEKPGRRFKVYNRHYLKQHGLD